MMMLPWKAFISSKGDTLFADDIWARVGYNGVTARSSLVVTVLQPCDQVLPQCDKLKIEQQARKETERNVYYNTTVSYSKESLGI